MIKQPCPIAAALVHHPIYNRSGDVVTTSVTSVDIHDIARACRTYGLGRYYLVTPILAQRDMIERVAGHWTDGSGNKAGHPRGEALKLVRTMPDIASAMKDFEEIYGTTPLVAATSAKPLDQGIKLADLREKIWSGELPGLLLIFGTGWGLTQDFTDDADFKVEPVGGPTDYRHLSVRTAAAITLDRLLGVGVY